MSKVEQFSSRWGLILASLGMAIGAGNLWRFPRLAGQYGGSFIVLWMLFLLIWSIPLLLSEFAIGKRVIGSFGKVAGRRLTFLGTFITVCTLGIAFYYGVVTTWAIRYFLFSLQNLVTKWQSGVSLSDKLVANPEYLNEFWLGMSSGNVWTVVLLALVILSSVFTLLKGVDEGLEKANRVLIPTLYGLLLLMVVVVLNMDNGVKGLEYMFAIRWSDFGNATIWIEAISQSAWSTGAGWGLLMTISAYSREKEDVTLNTFVGAFGNNTASILAAMAILSAVFALSPTESEAINYLQSGNQALTFTIIPRLFSEIPAGESLAVLFFLALSIAAFSSLLPMIELFQKNLSDLGIDRRRAFGVVVTVFFAFGFPSAWSLDFFSNQDWVWGLGLIITGLFILIAVVRYGPAKFKRELIDGDADMQVSTHYFTLFAFVNIPLGIFLVVWWLSQGYSANPWFNEAGQWNLFDVYSNASVVTQWAAVLLVALILNSYCYKKFVRT